VLHWCDPHREHIWEEASDADETKLLIARDFKEGTMGWRMAHLTLAELSGDFGIDLGKTLFHLVGVDACGNVVVRKRCSRTQLLRYTANLRVQRVEGVGRQGGLKDVRSTRKIGLPVRILRARATVESAETARTAP